MSQPQNSLDLNICHGRKIIKTSLFVTAFTIKLVVTAIGLIVMTRLVVTLQPSWSPHFSSGTYLPKLAQQSSSGQVLGELWVIFFRMKTTEQGI